ncbi:MAG TPA: electron transfer flavoprotein subunit alpha/FixB family protein [Candidatus Polarisedimenticolia bacterium]|nr:electron transfer flavoprotein subunit alpha/FixB family protein [Candidatus Polarisedimenticolia bacterium]
MPKDVLVFVESRAGQVKRPSLQALSEGRRVADALGAKLRALLIGSQVEALASELAAHGPDSVLIAEHPLLAHYQAEAFTAVLAEAVRTTASEYAFLSATAMGRDLAARAAARLEAGLASDCTHAEVTAGELRVKRPVYSGKAVATVRLAGSPSLATLRPNAFPLAAAPRTPSIEKLSLDLPESRIRARTTGIKASEAAEIDVAEAAIVVSGGRAMKGPENFALIRSLAEALGGAMGASRAAVDAGWVGHQYQVGQTGKVVSPMLYIACGISGAIQHLAGMSTSKVIVAINKDAEAPIFKLADYGIVGDLYEILPKLTEEVRRMKGQ